MGRTEDHLTKPSLIIKSKYVLPMTTGWSCECHCRNEYRWQKYLGHFIHAASKSILNNFSKSSIVSSLSLDDIKTNQSVLFCIYLLPDGIMTCALCNVSVTRRTWFHYQSHHALHWLLPHLSEHPHNWWEQCNRLWEIYPPWYYVLEKAIIVHNRYMAQIK